MKKINEWFLCLNCAKQVKSAEKTCRNHCNFCFATVHVDAKIPGDRQSDCNGSMFPIEYFISNWQTKIKFQCTKCSHIHINKVSTDDEVGELDVIIYKYKSKFLLSTDI